MQVGKWEERVIRGRARGRQGEREGKEGMGGKERVEERGKWSG